MTTGWQRLRIRQVRLCSRLLVKLGRIPAAAYALRILRDFPITRPILRLVIGYHRPFRTLGEAAASIEKLGSGGHSHPDNATLHAALALHPRPSDYAALFHLRPIFPQVRRVFDLGGNFGNLFYCYAKYLEFSPELVWTVYDVPEILAIGDRLARERGEKRLRFTASLEEAEGCDLLFASGSLHYMERLLGDIVAEMKRKPKYVLVNRTPLVEGRAGATVQDGGTFLVACNLFKRGDLVGTFEKAGYAVADSWRAEELSVHIPCYPELSVPAYSGLFCVASEGAGTVFSTCK